MKKLITFCLVLLAIKNWAQCTNTVTPLSQSISCTSGAISFTASCLNPTITVRHDWYSPSNPLPNGAPILTSNNPVSVFTGSLAPGVYTVVTTQIMPACSSSITFTVTSPDSYPTFSLNSPTNYSVGCAPLNQTTIAIINPVSTQTPPSTCSYTFLAPSFTGVVTPSVILGGNTSTITTFPGTWTVIVQDNGNYCRNILPVIISQNTTAPHVMASMVTQTLTCYNPTLLATGSSTTANASISWQVPSVPPVISLSTITVGPATGPNTSTTSLTYANYTVVATSTLNACQATSVVTINQNFKPPVSSPAISISSPTIVGCNGTPVVLTVGGSTTTSGGGINAFITNPCWQGPAPQTPTCGPSTYSCYVPGIYILNVMDNYNGCTSIGTVNVAGGGGGGSLIASYTHTVGPNGVVNFTNTSIATPSTTYGWNFGDGYVASGPFQTHTYTANGSYPVTLMLSDISTCSSGSVTQYVNITGFPCNANANFAIAPTPTPQYWVITPSYPYNITAASWNWGDGTSTNYLYASHQYSAAGSYSICLSVTVTCGASTTTCLTQYISRSSQDNSIINVQVNAPPLIGIKNIDPENASFLVYPNPNDGNLNIKIDNIQSKTNSVMAEVFDVLGKIVYTTSLTVTGGMVETKLNMDHLSNGSYYIRVKTDDRSYLSKLIISK